MAQDLSDDLILPGPLIQENLRAGMAKQVRVDLQTGASKDRRLDLWSESIGRFRTASLAREHCVRRRAHEMWAVVPDVPSHDVDRLRREFEVNRLVVLGVAFGTTR